MREKLRKVNRALDRATDLLAILAGSLILFMVASITYEIVLRNVFGHSANWTVEATSYSLLYLTFLATAWVLRRDGHVSMDMVIGRLKPRHQHLVNGMTSVLGALACVVITWFSAMTTWQNFQLGNFLNTELRPPQFVILMVIPIGSFLLSVQFLRRICQQWGKWRASSFNGRARTRTTNGGDGQWIGP